MSETGESDARRLSDLRDRIDAIDAEMHRLLVARGAVIDSLIRIKGTSRPGAAFRPAREADMMRRLAARHDGDLPLATVEHIWREIISTFTRMQASFDVAIDGTADPERMRDLARFTFGFSVKLVKASDPAAVVEHVSRGNDLGLVAMQQRDAGIAWWRALAGASAPRIIALLPFIKGTGRPADLPAFVIAPRLSDPTPPDLRIVGAVAEGDPARIEGVAVLSSTRSGDVLLALPSALDDAALREAAKQAGVGLSGLAEVGGVARGIAVGEKSSLLYQALETAPS
jgi:chorismate mutase/prephenate dehydratase